MVGQRPRQFSHLTRGGEGVEGRFRHGEALRHPAFGLFTMPDVLPDSEECV
jgi:hypothetical protein